MSAKGLTFTTGETALLIAIMTNIKDLNADWAAVAHMQNYKDAKIAKQRWGQVRCKIQAATPSTVDDNGATSTPAAKASPAKGNAKGKAAAKRTASYEEDSEETKVKPKRARTTKKAKVVGEEVSDNGTIDGVSAVGIDDEEMVKKEEEDEEA